MRKITLSLVSVFLIFSIAGAQQVSGIVKDEQGKGLEKTVTVRGRRIRPGCSR